MNSAIYAAVEERAAGHCECCGRPFGFSMADQPQLDHFEGRAVSETVETCWMLRAECHERKSARSPSIETWCLRFIVHCRKHRYIEAAERAQAKMEYHASKKELGNHG